jgi:PTH1 family peptidyl-tRNA hydrolase
VQDGLLIVGLGNPGPEYAQTRHNLGFMVVDELARRMGLSTFSDKFSSKLTTGRLAGQALVLLKPQTFMNRSGRAVARAAGFYAILPNRIVAIHDELDLPFATVRVKVDGGTAGHKGLASLKQELGTTAFVRVRLGIDRPARGNVADYVLMKFSLQEAPFLSDFVSAGADVVEHIAQCGLASAMNKYNVRPVPASE